MIKSFELASHFLNDTILQEVTSLWRENGWIMHGFD